MAKSPYQTPAPGPIAIGPSQATRIIMVLLGSIILGAALITPWWTRGTTIDEDEWARQNRENSQEDEFGDGGDEGTAGIPGVEGFYFNYAPFRTPGGGTLTVDASRATAVAILGIGLVACAVFAFAANLLRGLMATGRVEVNHDLTVRLSILAFIFGTFAVLWGLFFLPLAGDNPGMMWGSEHPENLDQASSGVVESTRYANVGFYLGIVGAMGYPAYLWFDAARVRALSGMTTTRAARSTSLTF